MRNQIVSSESILTPEQQVEWALRMRILSRSRMGIVCPSSEAPNREPRTITCEYCDKLLWIEEDRFTMIPRVCKNCGAAR